MSDPVSVEQQIAFNPLEFPLIQAMPERLTSVQSWQGLIPVAFALMALHRPQTLVELGTHRGDSYSAFCQAAAALGLPTRCHAVDTWQGDSQAGYYDDSIYDELRAYHDPRYGQFSRLIRSTFDEALTLFTEGSIDLLHIDGLHTYEAVAHDFDSWLPKMSARGVVLFHDTAVREGDFGVWRLWQELSARYPGRAFGFSNGLGILAVGNKALDSALGVWFALDETQWHVLETYFAALGERVVGETQRRILRGEIERLGQELTQAGAQMQADQKAWAQWNEQKAQAYEELRTAYDESQALAEARAQVIESNAQGIAALEAALAEERRRINLCDRIKRRFTRLAAQWTALWSSPTAGAEPAPQPLPEPVPQEDAVPAAAPGDMRGVAEIVEGCITRHIRHLPGVRRALVPRLVNVQGLDVEAGKLVVQTQGVLEFGFDAPFRVLKLVARMYWPAGEPAVTLQVGHAAGDGVVWSAATRFELREGAENILFLAGDRPANHVRLILPAGSRVEPVQLAFVAVTALEARLMNENTSTRRLLDLLRAYRNPVRKAWQLLRRDGLRGFLHNLRQKIGQSSAGPGAQADDASWGNVFEYMQQAPNASSTVPLRIALGVSSQGNFFMREIARSIEGGFRELGAQVYLFDENESIEARSHDWVVVVAPHEFFLLGSGSQRFSEFRKAPNLLLVNTEQPQTRWFATAGKYLRAAAAVLDINYQTACHLRRNGLRAFFLPLGYDASCEAAWASQRLPEHAAFLHLPPAVRESLPESYADRPIDILFVGTISRRRERFFARHAPYFAGRNAFIYLPEGNAPFLPGEARTLDFACMVGLIKRAKIVLNIHRDEHPYLEWQRIVTLGILQKTLVITDHCQRSPAVEANVDYVDGPLEALPALCEYYLAHPERAQAVAEAAYERMRSGYPMSRILRRLLPSLKQPQ